MAIFPTTIGPAAWYVNVKWQEHRILGRGVLDEVIEKLQSPIYECEFNFELDEVDGNTVRAFYNSCKGLETQFGFLGFEWDEVHSLVPVGTGDGVTKFWTIPFYDLIPGTEAMYVNSVLKTVSLDYEIGNENRLLRSEDFSNATSWAAVSGATVTRGGAHAGPTGNTAWHIETSGGSSAIKLRQTLSTTVVGDIVFLEVQVKNQGVNDVTIRIVDGASVKSETITADSLWHTVRLSIAYSSGNICVEFMAPTAGDSLDFLVWHPWVAYTSAVRGAPTASWGYVPTIGTAIVSDSCGRQHCCFYSAVTNAHQITISAPSTVRRCRVVRFTHRPMAIQAPQWRGYRMGYAVKGLL